MWFFYLEMDPNYSILVGVEECGGKKHTGGNCILAKNWGGFFLAELFFFFLAEFFFFFFWIHSGSSNTNFSPLNIFALCKWIETCFCFSFLLHHTFEYNFKGISHRFEGPLWNFHVHFYRICAKSFGSVVKGVRCNAIIELYNMYIIKKKKNNFLLR